jgi:hypothetical protein
MPGIFTPRPRPVSHARRTVAATAVEAGNALLLSLAFIVVIFTTVTGLLLAAHAGVKSVQGYRVDRTVRYGADGAIQATIELLKEHPELALALSNPSANPYCGLRVPLVDAGTGATAGTRATVTSGSYLQTTCTSIATVTSVDGIDASANQQLPRQVQIIVTCAPSTAATPLIDCKGGSTPREVGRARVRFEIDPGLGNQNQSAVVPKIVSYTILRQYP